MPENEKEWQFVPCKDPTEYDVCAYCQRQLRAYAHVIEGEGPEDRPYPGPDDHYEKLSGNGLLCGGSKCDHPPSVERCDGCGSTKLVFFSARCCDQFTALDLGTGEAYGCWNDQPSCHVPAGILGGGDYVSGALCLSCGKWQGEFPARVEDD
jgi:hypothetical protein